MLQRWLECVEKFPHTVVGAFRSLDRKWILCFVLAIDWVLLATDVHGTGVNAGIQPHALVFLQFSSLALRLF